MAKACDLCERVFIPRGEIYYEVSIRVRPAGEVSPEMATPPDGIAIGGEVELRNGLAAPDEGALAGAAVNGCAELDAQFDELAVEEFLAQALKTHRYTLCGTCRREFQADPIGKVRRDPVR
ncbi:MAG: hypothetical protein ACYTGX_08170 [Planctomycetota bacterium]|jgi:hypothetical protein